MSEVCDNFNQHAWKKDLCSNCLKPRNKHSSPVPAKRPQRAGDGQGEPENGAGFVGNGQQGSPAFGRQKPEARVKPTVAAKPGSPAKPAMIGAKPTVAPKAVVKPQQQGDSGEGAARGPADGAYDDVPSPVPVSPKTKHDPYYTEYDVSFKGMSGKPMPVGGHVRNKSIDRLKNDIEIVMPYNVVDVSTDPPITNPDYQDAKNGKGRSASPLLQGGDASPTPQKRGEASSPQFRRNIRILEDAMQQQNAATGGQQGKEQKPHTKKSPFQSPVLGRKPLVAGADLYEDVEDPEDVERSGFQRNTPLRSSSGKSAAFENKLTAIAQNLDFQKKGSGKQPPPPPPEPQGMTTKGQASSPNEPTNKKDKKKPKEEPKPEKQRKGSVGKSFFKKLFSRGGTESGDDSDAGPELSLSMDAGMDGPKPDDASSTKSSTPGSVEGSPLMSNTRHPIELEKKDPKKEPPKKPARAESVKEPAPFTAELRQALARGQKMGEKNSTVSRGKPEGRSAAVTHDAAFEELKGSPLFERRLQQRTYEDIDGDENFEPSESATNTIKARPKPEPKKMDSPSPAAKGTTSNHQQMVHIVPPEHNVDHVSQHSPPSPALRQIVTEHQQQPQKAVVSEMSIVMKTPPQVATKPTKPKPDAAAKPKPGNQPQQQQQQPKQQAPKPNVSKTQTSETPPKPEMTEAKTKLVSYPGDTATCKRRPAPAAPPPPAPMDAPANRRSQSCTSPVSPRPTGPPPPSPKFPDTTDGGAPGDAPPMLPEKSRKRDSLKGDEMELYSRRMEQQQQLPPPPPAPPPATAVPLPRPPPDPEGPPPPVLPEKTKKRNTTTDTNTASGAGEVYGKRPQISAPTLQRTSAVLDVTVEAGEGATLPDPPPPPGPKTSPPATSPESTSPQSTLTNSDRKQRPRSEISTGKTGTLRRKPDSAPPPPPPEGTRRLSAADVSPSSDNLQGNKRLSRGSSEEVITQKSQSLPRGGLQHNREPVRGGTLDRNQQRAGKTRQAGRAHTLSDTVTCDGINNEAGKHEALADLTAEITNKFSQRKLPSPPREDTPPRLPDNYYELIDEDDSPAAQRAARRNQAGIVGGGAASALAERARRERSATPYEDVPGETYDDMEFTRRGAASPNTAAAAAAGAAQQKVVVGTGGASPARAPTSAAGPGGGPRVNGEAPAATVRRQSLDPTQNSAMTASTDYMQPVHHDHSPQDECMSSVVTTGQPMAAVPLVMNLSGGGQQFELPPHHFPSHQQQHQPPQPAPSVHHHHQQQQVPAAPPPQTMVDAEYNDWRPKPIPRKKGSPTSSSSSSYVMLYSDDSGSDSSRGIPSGFNPAEGWYRLAELQICTLEQIRISLDSMFVGAPVTPTTLRWEDFTLESFVPVYCNVGIAFYRASTERLSNKECLLMLSLCPLPTEVATQPHLGILHPSALYQDLISATLFPDVSSDPRVYGQCGKVPTTVWVLPFASVCNFEEYCIGLRGLYATKLPIYHRYLCSALQQALSAILYLLNKGCCLQCFQADEILGVTPDGEQEPFVLVLPHHCHVDPKPLSHNPFVLEMGGLLMRLLDDRKLASACGMSLNQSRFFRGLYQVAKVLGRTNTVPTLFKAQLMCEFMLWGPGEQDLRAVLTSHNPQASLDVWLQLERARIIGRYAIEDFSATKEDAHRVHFLVSATDQTLWDTAQLLQQES